MMNRLEGHISKQVDEVVAKFLKRGGIFKSIYEASLNFKLQKENKWVSVSLQDFIDLCRYYEKNGEQDLKREVKLAIHFIDLSAICIENWLAPKLLNKAGKRELLELYELFCGDILTDKNFRCNLLEYRLRRILLQRYPLIARLKLLLSHDDHTLETKYMADLNEFPVCEPSEEYLSPILTFEANMAQLGQISALYSLP